MNLFWKNLWGGIRPTDRFEREMKQLAADMRRYEQTEQSAELAEYRQLAQAVSEAAFQEKKKTLKKSQYVETEEYRQEQRLRQLAQQPDLAFFLKERPERFAGYLTFAPVFSDEFDTHTPDPSRWTFGFQYPSETLFADHSFADEQQAYANGHNTSTTGSLLRIATKKESHTTRAWHSAKGFIEKEFEYTSDIIRSVKRQQGGVIQAKIRCTGKINHAFWLGADRKLPLIKIFHYDGKNIKVGSMDADGKNDATVTGLNPANFYIYTLIWEKKELVWMINNVVVHRTSTQIPKGDMYLTFNSFIPQNQQAREGILEVDWVRVYALSNPSRGGASGNAVETTKQTTN